MPAAPAHDREKQPDSSREPDGGGQPIPEIPKQIVHCRPLSHCFSGVSCIVSTPPCSRIGLNTLVGGVRPGRDFFVAFFGIALTETPICNREINQQRLKPSEGFRTSKCSSAGAFCTAVQSELNLIMEKSKQAHSHAKNQFSCCAWTCPCCLGIGTRF